MHFVVNTHKITDSNFREKLFARESVYFLHENEVAPAYKGRVLAILNDPQKKCQRGIISVENISALKVNQVLKFPPFKRTMIMQHCSIY